LRCAFNNRRDQQVFGAGIDGRLHDIDFPAQTFTARISHGGLTHPGLAEQARVHRNVPLVDYHPGGHQLAHCFFLPHPSHVQLVRVGQMQLKSFNSNLHRRK
jgi:hypothetical protein